MNNFNKEVIEQSKTIPVLVDFWAEWCGPCKILGPVLEKLAIKYKDRFRLVKVDTDANQEVAAQYGIKGIPNVKLFINGEVADEFTGALPEQSVDKWLQKVIPGKNQKEITAVKELLLEGNNAEAVVLLEKLIKAEPDNPEVKALLARTILFEDSSRALELITGIEDNTDFSELIESIKTISNLFTVNGLDNSEIAKQFNSAVESLKSKNFDSALEKFIDVIRTDRTFNDDGARKACIAIFKYLGEENEITLRHRRDFGSALYV
jgi:putative thioredoxin